MTNLKSEKKEEGGKNTKIIIILLIVLIILLIGVIVLLFTRGQNKESQNTGNQTEAETIDNTVLERGFVTEENADSAVQTMQDKVADGYFECNMTTEWTFPSGTESAIDSYVGNAESNHYTLYFDLVENESGEVLYSSPLIPVGSDIDKITLDKSLAAGEYKATVMYTMVDDDYNKVSQCGFGITITVLK